MLIRALFSFLMLPGVIAFLIPITFVYYAGIRDFQWAGTLVVLSGIWLLVWCVRDFYKAGKGTLAPWEPPQKMVVVGLYRYVRNPMYVGVLILVTGWSILFHSLILLVYTGILFSAFHISILTYEEPWLYQMFGEEWLSYKCRVPRWIPHLAGKKMVN